MYVQKKAIRAQMSLYGIFILLGIFLIAQKYIPYKWFLWAGLGLFTILTVISFIIYKKDNEDVSPVKEKELKYNQYILYVYMAFYLGLVISGNIESLPILPITWVIGIILILLATAGFIINLRIYLRKLQ